VVFRGKRAEKLGIWGEIKTNTGEVGSYSRETRRHSGGEGCWDEQVGNKSK